MVAIFGSNLHSVAKKNKSVLFGLYVGFNKAVQYGQKVVNPCSTKSWI